MNLSFNLALSYRYLKDPTSRQNFEDTLGQIPKLILTLHLNLFEAMFSNSDYELWAKITQDIPNCKEGILDL